MATQQTAVQASRGVDLLATSVQTAAWRGGLAILLTCGGTGLLSVALGPDNNWDLRFYHLYAPWAYWHGRYLYDVGPAQFQGFFNPTADFLFYGLTSSVLNETPRLIAFIMGAVHGLNAVLVLAIARHVLRTNQRAERVALSAAATLMGVSGAGPAPLLGTTSNDLISSIFVLGSLLAVLKAAEPAATGPAWRCFAWSGLSAGVAVGLKYTAIIFSPGLALVALVAAVRRKSDSGVIVFGLSAVAGLLALAGHHLLTLWLDFGNAVFPLFNNIFQSPDYEPVGLRDEQFLPRNIWQLLAYPFYWTRTNVHLVSELPFRDWRGAIAYVATATAMLAAVARRVRKQQPGAWSETRGLDLLFVFVIASYFAWALIFGNYRYAVTLEMLTGVVTLGALVSIVRSSWLRIGVAVAVLAVVSATTVYPDWGRGQYGARTIDVRVPPLPKNSVVLIASWQPAAYFIPFAEPSAQFLGIENNYLQLSQRNGLAAKVKALMHAPGRAKFVVNVGEIDRSELNKLLAQFDLALAATPCRPIRSNLLQDESEALSLCAAVDRPASGG
ncbi:MAG: hypothetical protein K2Y27_24285 [Xanthobacteraceae bacterium]|nr:hypothetical protein [Xanthobacteraceae bacterium]